MPSAWIPGVIATATGAALVGARLETVRVTGVKAEASASALAPFIGVFPITPPAFAATLTTYAPVVSVTHGSPVAFLAIYDNP